MGYQLFLWDFYKDFNTFVILIKEKYQLKLVKNFK